MRNFLRRKSGSQGASLISLVALLVVFLCVLGLMSMGAVNLYRSAVQRTWKSVPCEILSSRMEETFDSQGNRRFKVVVKYSYEFNGQKLTSFTLSPGLKFIGRDDGVSSWNVAEEQLKRYAAGTKTQ